MRLFLVRHGETVDNVAGLYAGTRNSPLTSHGVLQARRLGAYLASQHPPATHIFSSDLRRAVATAQAVIDAQASSLTADDNDGGGDGALPLKLVQLPDLRERDFGSAEGEKFGVSSLLLAGAESREQMRTRAQRVVRGHLEPLLLAGSDHEALVVVVAHGLVLDVLLRVLLARFGPVELARLSARSGTGHLASWSNTGYVEAVVRAGPKPVALADGDDGAAVTAVVASGDRKSPQLQHDRVSLSVVGVNVLRHLEGLKKTRGGIGSAQHDKRQRTLDSFFGPASKKPRVE
ncbi:phosphoglycerate mutase-like protein [Trichocladium antarcticum]|uniref:Phosphoglycerate mutase-like protein n=1 Tax=Trichocladium antarcticum TaxID=1450529 RepID=A0AAN6UQ00_9PEZI|nr:phosphoglycerate mutase-like protein [Trichocladium antarcticum]